MQGCGKVIMFSAQLTWRGPPYSASRLPSPVRRSVRRFYVVLVLLWLRHLHFAMYWFDVVWVSSYMDHNIPCDTIDVRFQLRFL
jgi:hypothetical protein